MRLTPVAVLLTGLVFIIPVQAAHDESDDERGGRGRGRDARVTFYRDADFRGGYFTLEAGEEISNLQMQQFSDGSAANDRISSIRIEGPIEVTVYRDSRFRSATRRLSRDVRNLTQDEGEWNDIISSIRTEFRRPGDARAERADIDQTIERVFREMLGRKPDLSPARRYRTRMLEDSWNEKDVRDEVRRSDEYKTAVDRLVRKAYRELLGREGDAGGVGNYVRHMLRDGWSEEDVRHSIREGEEYRERPREQGRR